MKKIIFSIFTVFMSYVSWSQSLNVASGGSVYISPKSFMHVEEDLGVDAQGALTVQSDATDSGSVIVNGTVTGDISYVRHINSTNWHFVSAPVIGQSIADFAASKDVGSSTYTVDGVAVVNDVTRSGTGETGDNYGVSIYENANNAGTRWEYYTIPGGSNPASGNFENGKGYSMKRSSVGTYSFQGTMATGDVTITIPANAITPEVSTNHLWSVVGNPYPSFLPANDPDNQTTSILDLNIDNLDPNNAYLQVWNGTSYQIINNASPLTYLAPGQGFMVDPKGNNITFTFPENLQVPQVSTPATFYKTAVTPTLVVRMSSDKKTAHTTLKYFSKTTTGLDIGWDAGAYVDVAPTFALDTHLVSDSKGVNFTLQCLPNTNYETSIVPLSVVAAAKETLTFSSEAAGLPENIKIYLEDKIENTITDITTTAHQVNMNTALNGIGRFYIHTTSNVLSVEEPNMANTLSIYKTSNANVRITGLQQKGTATAKIYSITGKEVLSHTFSMQTVYDIALPTNLSTGVYVIQLNTNNSKQSKKIVIE